MTQDTQAEAPESDQTEQYVVRFREVISRARDVTSLSHADAAEELRLEVHVIVAMEYADFSALGAPVFIKGHLRAYEKLLGLPENELVALYELIDPSSSEWQVPTPKQEKVKPANLAQWGLIFLLLLAIVAIVLFFVAANDGDMPDSDAMESAAVQVPAETSAEMAPLVIGEAEVQLEPKNADRDQPAAISVEADSSQELADPSLVRIEFDFADNSWVDVSDASSRKLYGEKAGGSRLEIVGQPPFSFVLGNAESVSMKVDGVVYSLPASSVRRNTARFELTQAQIEEIRQ